MAYEYIEQEIQDVQDEAEEVLRAAAAEHSQSDGDGYVTAAMSSGASGDESATESSSRHRSRTRRSNLGPERARRADAATSGSVRNSTRSETFPSQTTQKLEIQISDPPAHEVNLRVKDVDAQSQNQEIELKASSPHMSKASLSLKDDRSAASLPLASAHNSRISLLTEATFGDSIETLGLDEDFLAQQEKFGFMDMPTARLEPLSPPDISSKGIRLDDLSETGARPGGGGDMERQVRVDPEEEKLNAAAEAARLRFWQQIRREVALERRWEEEHRTQEKLGAMDQSLESRRAGALLTMGIDVPSQDRHKGNQQSKQLSVNNSSQNEVRGIQQPSEGGDANEPGQGEPDDTSVAFTDDISSVGLSLHTKEKTVADSVDDFTGPPIQVGPSNAPAPEHGTAKVVNQSQSVVEIKPTKAQAAPVRRQRGGKAGKKQKGKGKRKRKKVVAEVEKVEVEVVDLIAEAERARRAWLLEKALKEKRQKAMIVAREQYLAAMAAAWVRVKGGDFEESKLLLEEARRGVEIPRDIVSAHWKIDIKTLLNSMPVQQPVIDSSVNIKELTLGPIFAAVDEKRLTTMKCNEEEGTMENTMKSNEEEKDEANEDARSMVSSRGSQSVCQMNIFQPDLEEDKPGQVYGNIDADGGDIAEPVYHDKDLMFARIQFLNARLEDESMGMLDTLVSQLHPRVAMRVREKLVVEASKEQSKHLAMMLMSSTVGKSRRMELREIDRGERERANARYEFLVDEIAEDAATAAMESVVEDTMKAAVYVTAFEIMADGAVDSVTDTLVTDIVEDVLRETFEDLETLLSILKRQTTGDIQIENELRSVRLARLANSLNMERGRAKSPVNFKTAAVQMVDKCVFIARREAVRKIMMKWSTVLLDGNLIKPVCPETVSRESQTRESERMRFTPHSNRQSRESSRHRSRDQQRLRQEDAPPPEVGQGGRLWGSKSTMLISEDEILRYEAEHETEREKEVLPSEDGNKFPISPLRDAFDGNVITRPLLGLFEGMTDEDSSTVASETTHALVSLYKENLDGRGEFSSSMSWRLGTDSVSGLSGEMESLLREDSVQQSQREKNDVAFDESVGGVSFPLHVVDIRPLLEADVPLHIIGSRASRQGTRDTTGNSSRPPTGAREAVVSRAQTPRIPSTSHSRVGSANVNTSRFSTEDKRKYVVTQQAIDLAVSSSTPIKRLESDNRGLMGLSQFDMEPLLPPERPPPFATNEASGLISNTTSADIASEIKEFSSITFPHSIALATTSNAFGSVDDNIAEFDDDEVEVDVNIPTGITKVSKGVGAGWKSSDVKSIPTSQVTSKSARSRNAKRKQEDQDKEMAVLGSSLFDMALDNVTLGGSEFDGRRLLNETRSRTSGREHDLEFDQHHGIPTLRRPAKARKGKGKSYDIPLCDSDGGSGSDGSPKQGKDVDLVIVGRHQDMLPMSTSRHHQHHTSFSDSTDDDDEANINTSSGGQGLSDSSRSFLSTGDREMGRGPTAMDDSHDDDDEDDEGVLPCVSKGEVEIGVTSDSHRKRERAERRARRRRAQQKHRSIYSTEEKLIQSDGTTGSEASIQRPSHGRRNKTGQSQTLASSLDVSTGFDHHDHRPEGTEGDDKSFASNTDDYYIAYYKRSLEQVLVRALLEQTASLHDDLGNDFVKPFSDCAASTSLGAAGGDDWIPPNPVGEQEPEQDPPAVNGVEMEVEMQLGAQASLVESLLQWSETAGSVESLDTHLQGTSYKLPAGGDEFSSSSISHLEHISWAPVDSFLVGSNRSKVPSKLIDIGSSESQSTAQQPSAAREGSVESAAIPTSLDQLLQSLDVGSLSSMSDMSHGKSHLQHLSQSVSREGAGLGRPPTHRAPSTAGARASTGGGGGLKRPHPPPPRIKTSNATVQSRGDDHRTLMSGNTRPPSGIIGMRLGANSMDGDGDRVDGDGDDDWDDMSTGLLSIGSVDNIITSLTDAYPPLAKPPTPLAKPPTPLMMPPLTSITESLEAKMNDDDTVTSSMFVGVDDNAFILPAQGNIAVSFAPDVKPSHGDVIISSRPSTLRTSPPNTPQARVRPLYVSMGPPTDFLNALSMPSVTSTIPALTIDDMTEAIHKSSASGRHANPLSRVHRAAPRGVQRSAQQPHRKEKDAVDITDATPLLKAAADKGPLELLIEARTVYAPKPPSIEGKERKTPLARTRSLTRQETTRISKAPTTEHEIDDMDKVRERNSEINNESRSDFDVKSAVVGPGEVTSSISSDGAESGDKVVNGLASTSLSLVSGDTLLRMPTTKGHTTKGPISEGLSSFNNSNTRPQSKRVAAKAISKQPVRLPPSTLTEESTTTLPDVPSRGAIVSVKIKKSKKLVAGSSQPTNMAMALPVPAFPMDEVEKLAELLDPHAQFKIRAMAPYVPKFTRDRKQLGIDCLLDERTSISQESQATSSERGGKDDMD